MQDATRPFADLCRLRNYWIFSLVPTFHHHTHTHEYRRHLHHECLRYVHLFIVNVCVCVCVWVGKHKWERKFSYGWQCKILCIYLSTVDFRCFPFHSLKQEDLPSHATSTVPKAYSGSKSFILNLLWQPIQSIHRSYALKASRNVILGMQNIHERLWLEQAVDPITIYAVTHNTQPICYPTRVRRTIIVLVHFLIDICIQLAWCCAPNN